MMADRTDLRPTLLASIAVAATRTHHQRVLAARDRVHIALLPWFPAEGHGGARDVANNLAAWMAEEPAETRWADVCRSLRAKGLRGRDLEKAAMAVCDAWAHAMEAT